MTSALSTVGALWTRELRKFVRERTRVIGALVQPLAFWLLLGLGFGGTFQMPADQLAGGAEVSYLTYLFPGILTLVALFTAIFSTIYVVDERQSGFLQAALVSPAPRWAITLGNLLGGTTLAVAQGALFLAAAPFAGFRLSLGGIVLALVVLGLLALAFSSLGYVIAWKVSTTRGFHGLMNVVLLPLWFVSGAAFPPGGAPDALAWAIRLNPVHYGVEALRSALYLPAASPLEAPGLGLSVLVAALFALVMGAWATAVTRRAA
jgi:ABC-2 type transport system permease protein